MLGRHADQGCVAVLPTLGSTGAPTVWPAENPFKTASCQTSLPFQTAPFVFF